MCFSILERIVGIETTSADHLRECVDGRFSILERIVGIETEIEVGERVAELVFQYPRTDRWH